MAMMRTTTPGSLTGSLSASGTMSANITVGTVNMAAADMTNYYDKEEVDGLLEGKADVDHDHTVKAGVIELTLQEANDGILKSKTTETQVNTLINNYAAPIEHVHDQYALQSDIPSIDGLATEEYVNEKVDSIDIPEVDLSGLATKEELNGKADSEHVHDQYLTEHQSLDHLALKDHTHEEYLTEHQDLSHLATKEELNGKADSDHTHDQYLTEHQDLSHLATKEELTSIDGLASTTYVDNAINTALNGIESQLDQIIGEEV